MIKELQPIIVFGDPAPKGSLRSFRNKYTGRRVYVPDNAQHQDTWKKNVILAARKVHAQPISGAVSLTIDFQVPRPMSDFTTNGSLKPKSLQYPIKKPDIDKLVRAVQDNLKSIAWHDDNQVCQLIVNKKYNPSPIASCKTVITVVGME